MQQENNGFFFLPDPIYDITNTRHLHRYPQKKIQSSQKTSLLLSVGNNKFQNY